MGIHKRGHRGEHHTSNQEIQFLKMLG